VTERLTFVFATVGTDHHPFDRLVEWVDAWAEENLGRATCTIQIGTSRGPRTARGIDYADRNEMERLIGQADIVICHGGPGTISDVRRHGRLPIVVPRRADLREHVDAHQVIYARYLARIGDILLAEDRGSLDRLLSDALSEPSSVRLDAAAEVDPTAAVRRFTELVDPLLAGRPRRGPWARRDRKEPGP
jgi:UDP-N-acetylglucosamine transferase subunit ALG13